LSSSVARSAISIKLQHKNNNFSFSVVNIYGPYADRTSFWEDLVTTGFFRDPFLVVGGDLNITLSLREVWGAHPRADRKRLFFQAFFEKANLVDIEPVKLSPTWQNFRTGEEEVAKRLDLFLVSEALLNSGALFRSGVEVGGISDHLPVSLQWSSSFDSPPPPPLP
jgi:exonuclease III